MPKKTLKRRQKLYKMKGCSTRKTTRKYLGGNALEAAYPNTGPVNVGRSTIPTNMSGNQRGGNCGCGQIFTGGARGGARGGNCSSCGLQQGGQSCSTQGLIGQPWTPNPQGWPGVNGSRNYLELNAYKVDPQTSMINLGANPPFLGGRGRGRGRGRGSKKSKRRRQKGGALSNFIGQDIINLGRDIQFGIGSAYNGINGYAAPVNPLPWRDQLPRTPNIGSSSQMPV